VEGMTAVANMFICYSRKVSSSSFSSKMEPLIYGHYGPVCVVKKTKEKFLLVLLS
jgi:hypothetical protein